MRKKQSNFFFTLNTSTANTSYGHSLTLNSPRQLHGNLRILNPPTTARETEPLILAGISSTLIRFKQQILEYELDMLRCKHTHTSEGNLGDEMQVTYCLFSYQQFSPELVSEPFIPLLSSVF